MSFIKDKFPEVFCGDSGEAARRIFNEKYHRVIMFHYNKKTLQLMIDKVINTIREANKKIPDVDNQWLPTVYWWDDIDGCLAVHCVEIGMDRFADSAGCLHLFAQPMYEVLTDPSARKPLSDKALSTIAMMGYLMGGGDK